MRALVAATLVVLVVAAMAFPEDVKVTKQEKQVPVAPSFGTSIASGKPAIFRMLGSGPGLKLVPLTPPDADQLIMPCPFGSLVNVTVHVQPLL